MNVPLGLISEHLKCITPFDTDSSETIQKKRDTTSFNHMHSKNSASSLK